MDGKVLLWWGEILLVLAQLGKPSNESYFAIVTAWPVNNRISQLCSLQFAETVLQLHCQGAITMLQSPEPSNSCPLLVSLLITDMTHWWGQFYLIQSAANTRAMPICVKYTLWKWGVFSTTSRHPTHSFPPLIWLAPTTKMLSLDLDTQVNRPLALPILHWIHHWLILQWDEKVLKPEDLM